MDDFATNAKIANFEKSIWEFGRVTGNMNVRMISSDRKESAYVRI